MRAFERSVFPRNTLQSFPEAFRVEWRRGRNNSAT
jgi:hypothetical protein